STRRRRKQAELAPPSNQVSRLWPDIPHTRARKRKASTAASGCPVSLPNDLPPAVLRPRGRTGPPGAGAQVTAQTGVAPGADPETSARQGSQNPSSAG